MLSIMVLSLLMMQGPFVTGPSNLSPTQTISPVAAVHDPVVPGLSYPLYDPSAAPAALPYPFHGVDRSSTEFECLFGQEFSEGPYNLSSVQAMRDWNVTAVRIPLDEDCWLGINGVPANTSGAPYHEYIRTYVDLLESQGIRPILALFFNAPGTTLSDTTQPMIDEDHGPAFWASVAAYFQHDSLVIFDLYNEPHDISWSCWLDGCLQTYTNPGWQTAGMQQLVDVVRTAGADTQVLMLGGLDWANDLTSWLSYKPVDPAGSGLLAASVHVYNWKACASSSCWNSEYLPIMEAGIPVITGELGENDCNTSHSFIDSYFSWATPLGVPFLGWTWDPWAQYGCPVLISNYSGTPYLAYGADFRDHLLGFPAPSLVTPSVPLAVLAQPKSTSVYVSWSPPANAGTWPVNNFTVAWGTSPASLTRNFSTDSGSITGCSVGGLTNGQTYYFSVRAGNPIGWGPYSTPITATPVANLSTYALASPLYGPEPLTVSFTGTVSGGLSPYTYLWNYGDGTHNSTAQNPIHQYNMTGNFSITCTATDKRGNTSVGHTNVSVAPVPPMTGTISATPTNGTEPLSVSFSSTVSGGVPPYSFVWSFGDGSLGSLAPSPIHLYNSTGTFEVKFVARDSGVRMVNRFTNITVSEPLVVLSSLIVSPSSATVKSGSSVSFSAVPSCDGGPCPSGITYSWTLTNSRGDLSASTGQNVTFAAGPAAGSDTIFVNASLSETTVEAPEVAITITSSGQGWPTISSFTITPSNLTVGDTVTFSVSASGGSPPYTYGYSGLPSGCVSSNVSAFNCTPTAAGNYTVAVIVLDRNAHSAEAFASLAVNPAPSSTSPPPGGISSLWPFSEQTLWLIAVVAVVVVVAVVLLLARRKTRSAEPPPDYPPWTPPPYPPWG